MNEVELIDEISNASQAYYTGEPIISDEKFDKLIEQLREISPDNVILKTPGWGYKPAGESKVKHSFLVGSLNKIRYTDLTREKLLRYDFVTPKLDGGSVVCYYKNGILDKIVSRGDGTIGLDITSNLLHAVPNTIQYSGDFAVRGEVVLSWENFRSMNGYSHPRNAAVGLSQAKYVDNSIRKLEVIVYSAYADGRTVDKGSMLDAFRLEGFNGVSFYSAIAVAREEDGAEQFYREMKEIYPCDGVVLSDMNDNSIAVKFEEERYITTVKSIDWQVGRTGRIVPVANIETVNIDGANISRVTCHNYGFIRDNGIDSGASIEIVRSNDVIPKITGVIEESGEVNDPTFCSVCGNGLVTNESGLDLLCDNPECPRKLDEIIFRMFEMVKPDGIGDVTLEIMLSGIRQDNIYDLSELLNGIKYMITPAYYYVVESSFGEVTANKICNMLSDLAIYKPTVSELLYIANIPAIGESTCENFKDVHPNDLIEIVTNSHLYLHILGEKFSNYLARDNFQKFLPRVQILINFFGGLREETVDEKGNKLEGKTFCITGTLSKKRDDIIKLITDNGGKFKGNAGSVDYLIVGDSPGQNKLEDARSRGVTTIDESEFIIMIGE